MDGTTDLTGVNKRTLTLTNGQVIWDLAGNVWEWTAGQTTGRQPGVAGAGWNWREWISITANGTLLINPSSAGTGFSGANTWNTGNGIGVIYSNSDDNGLRGFLRGGYCNDGGLAGVLTLSLGYAPSNAGGSFGFRVSR